MAVREEAAHTLKACGGELLAGILQAQFRSAQHPDERALIAAQAINGKIHVPVKEFMQLFGQSVQVE